MKKILHQMILAAAQKAFEDGHLTSSEFPGVEIEAPKIATHGDFSTNLAMIMAATQRMPPRKIARAIHDHLVDAEGLLDKTEIAGPGFINFFIKPAAWSPVLAQIHAAGAQFGACNLGRGQKIQVEFVSSNPTGPLHVGHGRGAAVGDSVARILGICGYDVQREYYINDSGRQINTLGRSVFLRYRQILGETVEFPSECYQGDYIRDYAEALKVRWDRDLLAREADEAVDICARFAAERIIALIRRDLTD
jgi:arginyl-tRNA synthetase